MSTTTLTLQDWVEEATGYDPVTEPAFGWSKGLPCDGCGATGETALLIFADDGVTSERLCVTCAVTR